MSSRILGVARSQLDIFVAGGSQHTTNLHVLLPQLHQIGRVQFSPICMTSFDICKLRPYVDVVVSSRYAGTCYQQFNLFCIRDINYLARAPFFLKIDADVILAEGWLAYLDSLIERCRSSILAGPTQGRIPINFSVDSTELSKILGRPIHIRGSPKVVGHFYVANTAFFKEHDRAMITIHDLLYCHRRGVRVRPKPDRSLLPKDPIEFAIRGRTRRLQLIGCEDTLRSAIAHLFGPPDAVTVVPSEVVYAPPGNRLRL